MTNTKSTIKPIKIRKESGTTYCFGCKDYMKSFNVKMATRVLREKSHCLACRSNQSRF